LEKFELCLEIVVVEGFDLENVFKAQDVRLPTDEKLAFSGIHQSGKKRKQSYLGEYCQGSDHNNSLSSQGNPP